MKAIVTEVSGDLAKIKVIGGKVEKGREYLIEDATAGTQAQNKAFHGLLNAFWVWMRKTDTWQFENGESVIDLSTPSAWDFRELFKARYGAGFSHIEFVNDRNGMERVKNWEDVPQYALDDFNAGNRGRLKGVLKSWADYGKRERKEAIDNLFWLVAVSGCQDRKVQEILAGMDSTVAAVREVFQ